MTATLLDQYKAIMKGCCQIEARVEARGFALACQSIQKADMTRLTDDIADDRDAVVELATKEGIL